MPPLLKRKGNRNQNMNTNNVNNGPGPSNTGQRIHLRRVPTKQEVIKQNLKNLQEKSLKKKIAQEHYYKNNNGRSPLKRQGPNVNVARNNAKSTIHNRLGDVQPKLQTASFQNRRLQSQQVRRPVQGRVKSNVTNRNQKYTKVQGVQQRINRIRKNFHTNDGAALAQTGKLGGKIRLRRTRPINYTVEVQNSEWPKTKPSMKRPARKQANPLNPKLQAEIRAIQSRHLSMENVEHNPAVEIKQVRFGCTTVSLNDRFTKLM